MTNQPSQPMPRVAVCLAAFNGAKWLDEQLDSILGQTGVSVTVFVSIDPSSDGTEELVMRRAAADARIVALSCGERFGGAAPNFFRLLRDVDFSGFDYASLADQDDIWFADKLVRAHEVMVSTDADAYSGNVIAFWPSGRKALIRKSQPQAKWDFLFEAAGPGCTYVMKAGLAKSIQVLLQERRAEVREVELHDWFFYAFARTHGYRWIIDDHAGMLYRQHEENQVGANEGMRALLQRATRVLGGGWGLAQAAMIARLTSLGDDPFVRHWAGGGCGGLLWLALHSWQCRRRIRDKILFAAYCVVSCMFRLDGVQSSGRDGGTLLRN